MIPIYSTKDIKRHCIKLNYKYSGREEEKEYKQFLHKDWFGRFEVFTFIDKMIAEGYKENNTEKVVSLQGLKNKLLEEIKTKKELRDG